MYDYQNMILKKIEAYSNEPTNEMIKDLISKDTDRLKDIELWRDQYNNNQKIMKDKPKGGSRPDHRIPINFNKVVINIAKNYLLAKPSTLSNKINKEEELYNEIDKAIKVINQVENNNHGHKRTKDIYKSMMRDTEAFEYVYYNDDEIKVVKFDSKECIAIYDTKGRLQLVLRYYKLGYGSDERYKVEIYDKEKVSYYIENENGKFVEDVETEDGVYYHWLDVVPIVHYVNPDNRSDLADVKTLNDAYNSTVSEAKNELSYSASSYLKIINAVLGETTEEAIETASILERLRMIVLNKNNEEQGDPDADFIEKNIPIEAQEKFLDRVKSDLLFTSMTPNIFDNNDNYSNLSSVAIQKLYTLADIKANDREDELKEGIKKRNQLIIKYNAIKDNRSRVDYILEDLNKKKLWNYIEISFDRNTMINAKETIENITTATNGRIMSKETAIRNNPYVQDVERELLMIEEEEQGEMADIYNALSSDNDDNRED